MAVGHSSSHMKELEANRAPASPEQALWAIIEASNVIDLDGYHFLVIELPPSLEAYLAVFGADQTELELDDWPEEDDHAEDDDPRE